MATLTGQYISQSYGGVINLSTNTGIVTGSFTQLQDGLGTNLGVFFNGQGIISGSAVRAASFTGSLFGTSSFATSASFATTASFAINATNWTTSSVDVLINSITTGRGKGSNTSTNTTFGQVALDNNTTGEQLTAIGMQALGGNTAGNYSTAIGYRALASSTGSAATSDSNTAVGWRAMSGGYPGVSNTALGAEAGDANSGTGNLFLGAFAGRNGTFGIENMAIGFESLYHFQTGSKNIAIGDLAQYENRVGWRNIALGHQSLKANYYASDNIAIGMYAGYDLYQGNGNNIFIGTNAGRNITNGSGNVILGGVSASLSAGLVDNIIIADGSGTIRMRYSGSWTMSGIVNTTASFATSASFATTASFVATASFATTASFASNYTTTGSFTGSFTGSLLGTSSFALAGPFVGISSNNAYTGNQVYSGSTSFRVIPVSIASSTASLNLASGSFYTIDLAGGNTHITAVSASRGQSSILQLTQPFAGNATVTFSSTFTFPTGSAFSASLSQSAVDIVSFVSFNGTSLRSLGANNYIPV